MFAVCAAEWLRDRAAHAPTRSPGRTVDFKPVDTRNHCWRSTCHPLRHVGFASTFPRQRGVGVRNVDPASTSHPVPGSAAECLPVAAGAVFFRAADCCSLAVVAWFSCYCGCGGRGGARGQMDSRRLPRRADLCQVPAAAWCADAPRRAERRRNADRGRSRSHHTRAHRLRHRPARSGPLAVVRLDALARATGFKVDDVLCVAGRHPGARGLRQLETALELVDPGAQSPKESYLRLLLIDAGFPRPRTQIPVPGADGIPFAYLDLGWEDYMVAVEYDGDHHQRDRQQYVKDIRRAELLEQMGWVIIRVVAEDRPADILRRVRAAVRERTSVVR